MTKKTRKSSHAGSPSGVAPTSPSEAKALLEKYGLKPNKNLGQCFLTDSNVLSKIASAATHGVTSAIEIGPGLGALTFALAETGVDVVAVEKDKGLVAVLEDLFSSTPNVRIVHGDATKIDFSELLPKRQPAVVGNLPYSVSTPLLLAILAQRHATERATVMLQRELADRLVASPGTKAYGSPSVLFQLHAELDKLFEVPPGCFFPKPKVQSAVLEIRWLESPRFAIADEALLEQLVRAAFGQRRKTLRNALSQRFDRTLVERSAKDVDIDLGRRAETLSVRDFVRLSERLSSYL